MRKRAGFLLVLLISCSPVGAAAPSSTTRSVPIIYSTDLYHPHEDPDDHYDLATLFAMPEFDIRSVIFDMGPNGKGRAGVPALRQIMHLTGRTVPYAMGLAENLRSPDDRADHQSAEAQAGVELLLKALRESTGPVTLFATGSLRDIAAAYNRAPDVLRQKINRLYVNAGHSAGAEEWNVTLDPHAYVRILRSDLPVYWVPCFGANGYFSHWAFRQGDVLDALSPALRNYFLYALTKAPASLDPIAALSQPHAAEVKQKIWNAQRQMWCTAAFLHAAGRADDTFTFEKVTVRLNEKGGTNKAGGGPGLAIMTFRHFNLAAYTKRMTESLRRILQDVGSHES